MRRRRLVLVAPWKLARAVVLLVVLVALVGFATHKWVDRGRDARAMATAPAAAQTLPETPASASATASASALATVASPAPTPTATATAGPTQAPAPRVDEQGFSHSDAVGDGTWTIADPVAPSQPGAATVYRYVLRVEGGTSVDAAAAAVVVENVLNDDRGWRGTEGVSFEQVGDPAAADFTLSIATPTTTDALCAPLETIGMWNCRNGTNVVLNSDRWTYGSPTFSSVDAYHVYEINHEVGHFLGHEHEYCAGAGLTSPVMAQQSRTREGGCTENGWPTRDNQAH
ncbi:DUF3152 domain-containing protein [Actinomyces dentalis]|uniref:DUF3152 domain-containing protein n=1 Tax=Actinomyces dentalis TaxID=272548 RepID=UPI00041D9FDF|nr:DUF3152 domain-containing protein [Actinomyces dentalis]